MFGAIIGDVVGSVYEWDNIKTKDFKLFNEKNFFTDDTVMTIAVAKSLIDCNGNYDNLSEVTINNMVKFGRENINCGFGGSFIKWIISDNHEPYNSYGNGSAMRVSPCGMIANSIGQAIDLAHKVTCISHNHPEGIKGAEAVSVAIYLAKIGKSKLEIQKYITDNYYRINFTLDEIRDNYKFDVTCQGSVPQAFEAFFESKSFEDTIKNAISIGGDSDTIAAIAGSIAGMYYDDYELITEETKKYLPNYFIEIIDEFNNLINNKSKSL